MSSASPRDGGDIAVIVSGSNRIAATAISWLATRAFPTADIDHGVSLHDVLAAARRKRYELALLHLPNPRVSWSRCGPELKDGRRIGQIVVFVERADWQAARLSRVARGCSILDAGTESIGALCGRLRRAAAGHVHVSRSIRAAAASDTLNPELLLTAAEGRVFAVIGAGVDDTTAARALGIQPATVMTHRSRIMRKLNVRHRGELIRAAIRYGYVTVGTNGDLQPASETADPS